MMDEKYPLKQLRYAKPTAPVSVVLCPVSYVPSPSAPFPLSMSFSAFLGEWSSQGAVTLANTDMGRPSYHSEHRPRMTLSLSGQDTDNKRSRERDREGASATLCQCLPSARIHCAKTLHEIG